MRDGTFRNGAVHGDQLAARGGEQFLHRFTAIGVWVFSHGFQRLWRVIRSKTEQHCNSPSFRFADCLPVEGSVRIPVGARPRAKLGLFDFPGSVVGDVHCKIATGTRQGGHRVARKWLTA